MMGDDEPIVERARPERVALLRDIEALRREVSGWRWSSRALEAGRLLRMTDAMRARRERERDRVLGLLRSALASMEVDSDAGFRAARTFYQQALASWQTFRREAARISNEAHAVTSPVETATQRTTEALRDAGSAASSMLQTGLGCAVLAAVAYFVLTKRSA